MEELELLPTRSRGKQNFWDYGVEITFLNYNLLPVAH